MNRNNVVWSRSVVLLFASIPVAAHAYIGPGAGLTAIGTVLAAIGAVVLLIIGFVWYPVKRMFSKRDKQRETRNIDQDGNTEKSDAAE